MLLLGSFCFIREARNMAKVKVDLGVAEVIGKVKDTETINQADKTTALLIRAVHAALSPLEKWVLQKESNIE